MKKILLLVFACSLGVSLPAATAVTFPEVKLANGEVLKDVTLLSQTPTHVTFKTAKGMKQVDKRQLPAELQQTYPYDANAAEQRKAALAEAEAKRIADREAKKIAAPADLAKGPAGSVAHEKLGVLITFSSDGEGSGPMITLINNTGVDRQFSKKSISARMTDDKIQVLKIAARGEKLEKGGAMEIVGDTLKVPANGSLEFRGYFYGNYATVKHSIADVYWNAN